MVERGDSTGREGIARTDATTIVAFAALVLIGGANAVAVRFSNLELPPFWGAASRFLVAAAVYWIILLVSRASLPRGRALVGSVLYGTLAIGVSYALLYWALLELEASFAVVLLSLGPLFTILLAAAHRLEPFRWRGVLGALIALAGVSVGVGAEFGGSVPVASLVAMIAGVVCISEGSVVYKLFTGMEPLATNVVATTTGAVILVGISLLAGESWGVPSEGSTIVAFAYLALIGTVVLFYVYLVVLSRWTASATSYAFLLFPIATIGIASLITDETVTWQFLVGAAVALLGVWIGALWKPHPERMAEKAEPGAAPSCEPPNPGCA